MIKVKLQLNNGFAGNYSLKENVPSACYVSYTLLGSG